MPISPICFSEPSGYFKVFFPGVTVNSRKFSSRFILSLSGFSGLPCIIEVISCHVLMEAPSISTILSPFFMPAFSATAFLITSPTSGYKRGIIPISITSVFSPNMFFPVFFSGVMGSSIIFPSLSILKKASHHGFHLQKYQCHPIRRQSCR